MPEPRHPFDSTARILIEDQLENQLPQYNPEDYPKNSLAHVLAQGPKYVTHTSQNQYIK